MIGKITSGASFKGLARYLTGRDERVAFAATRNTYEQEPMKAAEEMAERALISGRTEKPVYHFSINFAPTDRAGRALMEKSVEQTLSDLGLAEHQAVVVAHNDTQHPHVHVMVSRVHPDTGRVWNRWQDRNALKTSLERQERRFGLQPTGRNVSRGSTQREPKKSLPPAEHAKRSPGRLPAADKQLENGWAREAAGKRQTVPTRPRNGDAIRLGTAIVREVVEPSEDEREAFRKAGRAIQAAGLLAARAYERRRRLPVGAPENSPRPAAELTQGAANGLKRLEWQQALERRFAELKAAVKKGESRLGQQEALRMEVATVREAIGRRLLETYAAPEKAAQALVRRIRQVGSKQAAQELRRRPEAFGPLRHNKDRSAAGRQLAGVIGQHARLKAAGPGGPAEKQLRRQVEEGRSRLDKLTRQMGQHPSAEQLREALAEKTARLSRPQIQRLTRGLERNQARFLLELRAEGQARQLVGDLKTFERVRVLEGERGRLAAQIVSCERTLSDQAHYRQEARDAQQAFKHHLRSAYADPTKARQLLGQAAQEKGEAAASQLLRRQPGRYGKLQVAREKRFWGLIVRESTGQARAAAQLAAQAYENERALQEVLMHPKRRQRLEKTVDQAKKRSQTITRRLESLPPSQKLKQRIGRRFHAMNRKAREAAARMLSKNQLSLAVAAARQAKEVACGRDR